MPNPPLKTVKVQLRITPLEREYLQALADRNQLNISEYIRMLIHREASRL